MPDCQGRGLSSAGLTAALGLEGADCERRAVLTFAPAVGASADSLTGGLLPCWDDGNALGMDDGGFEVGFAVTTGCIGLLDEKGAALAGAGLAGTAAAAFSIGLSSP